MRHQSWLEGGYAGAVIGGWLTALIMLPGFVSAAPAVRTLPDFTQIVEHVSPAVVNISTSQKVAAGPSRRGPHGKQRPDIPEGTPFDDFFRHYFGDPGDDNGDNGDDDGKSLGSGFIVSVDGYVLTNHHVVKDADEIIVRLSDKREFKAKVVGSDPRIDVSVLKIDAQGLPAVEIGHSSKLKAGEWVLAIGSPFDFDHSVTAGIVSAVGRALPNENYVPFIQTDVAINPGNSGGPLFNMDGEVVGINSQIYSRTGGFMGLSFAIPIDLAMKEVDQLKQGGKVSRGWLGILIQDVDRELAESFGMSRPGGALVARVMPSSPAEKAGFEVGDVVVEFNGQTVTDSASLPPIVGNTAVNSKVPVKIIREGKPRALSVTIGELPDDDGEVAAADLGGYADKRLGVTISEVPPEIKDQLDNKKQGVFVEDVRKGPAARAGLHRGDVIIKINQVEIRNVGDFKRAVESVPKGKSVPMLVQRRGGPVFLALKLSEEG